MTEEAGREQMVEDAPPAAEACAGEGAAAVGRLRAEDAAAGVDAGAAVAVRTWKRGASGVVEAV